MVGDRISPNHDEIGDLAHLDRAELRVLAQHPGAIQRHDLDRLLRREAALDEQLVVTLIAEAWQSAAVSGGIDAGGKQTARVREHLLEALRAPEEFRLC